MLDFQLTNSNEFNSRVSKAKLCSMKMGKYCSLQVCRKGSNNKHTKHRTSPSFLATNWFNDFWCWMLELKTLKGKSSFFYKQIIQSFYKIKQNMARKRKEGSFAIKINKWKKEKENKKKFEREMRVKTFDTIFYFQFVYMMMVCCFVVLF